MKVPRRLRESLSWNSSSGSPIDEPVISAVHSQSEPLSKSDLAPTGEPFISHRHAKEASSGSGFVLVPMSNTPRKVGTLVVVVLKANHLPNKRHIGKQAPYCVCTVNGEKRRTKAIHRGGQHPEWDEELRFTLYEDIDDEVARSAIESVDGSLPPPPPPKESSKPGSKKVKGGTSMRLSCFADDPREPDLIGETDVNLTEVLTKGETDEWFTLFYKGKFAGKVYLELTFWSNEPAPEKKSTPTLPTPNRQYGGPGSFTAEGDRPPALPNGYQPAGRTMSMYEHSRRPSDSIASTIRSSVATKPGLDLYQAPYERNSSTTPTTVSSLINDFGVLDVAGRPQNGGTYPPPQLSPINQNSRPPEQSSGFYNQPVGSISQSSLHNSRSISGYHPPYHQSFENGQPTSLTAPPAPGRSRLPIPQSSSGFVPIPTSSSGFVPLNESSPTPAPGGFVPQPSATPNPTGFVQQSHFSHPGYAPTPTPGGYASAPYQQQPYGYHSQHYTLPPTSGPTPTQSYIPTSSVPQGYDPGYHENITPPPPPPVPPSVVTNSLSGSMGPGGSRPLPHPSGPPALQPSQSYSPQSASQYSPSHPNTVAFPSGSPYQNVPPPPPLGPQDGYYSSPPPTNGVTHVSPPIPPPPPNINPGPQQGQKTLSAPTRRPSLPPPPVTSYAPSHQHQGYSQQALPGPPPPLPPPPPPPAPQNSGYSHPLPPPPAPPSQGVAYSSAPPLPPAPMTTNQQSWGMWQQQPDPQ